MHASRVPTTKQIRMPRGRNVMMLLAHRKHKAGDAFRRQHAERHLAYSEAPTLRERFPGVEEVVVDLNFEDFQRLGIYSGQRRSFAGAARAYFAIPCPRTLCLGGGFDLDALVFKLIRGGRTAGSGMLECCGSLNPQIPDAHCRLRLNYQVFVRYAEAGDAGPAR
jgi:hypothetical protein